MTKLIGDVESKKVGIFNMLHCVGSHKNCGGQFPLTVVRN